MFSLNVNFVEWPIWSVNVCLNHLAQMLPALYKSLLDCLIQLQLRNHFGWLLEISHLSHIHTLQWFLSSWQSPTWCSSPWGQGRGWTENLVPVTLNTGWWLTTGASTASTSTPSPSTSGFTASCSSLYPVSSSPSSPLASSMPCTRHVKQLLFGELIIRYEIRQQKMLQSCEVAARERRTRTTAPRKPPSSSSSSSSSFSLRSSRWYGNTICLFTQKHLSLCIFRILILCKRGLKPLLISGEEFWLKIFNGTCLHQEMHFLGKGFWWHGAHIVEYWTK